MSHPPFTPNILRTVRCAQHRTLGEWAEILVLALAFLFVFGFPVWRGFMAAGVDGSAYGISYKFLIWQKLRTGQLPAWFSEQGFGFPALAAGQAGLFSPWNLFLLLPLPFPLSYGLMRLLGHFVLAWGTYLLFRQEGMRRKEALLAALLLAGMGFALAHTEIPAVVHSLAWFPWWLWAGERWLQEGRPADFALALLFLFFTLSGGYPLIWGFGLLAWFLWSLFGGRARFFRGLALLGASAAVGAVFWVPLLLHAAISLRVVTLRSVPLVRLDARLFPYFLQPAIRPADPYRAYGAQGYLGVVGLVGMLFLLWWSVGRARDRKYAAMLILGLLITTGALFFTVEQSVSHPMRAWFLVNLPTAYAVGRLLEARPPLMAPLLLAKGVLALLWPPYGPGAWWVGLVLYGAAVVASRGPSALLAGVLLLEMLGYWVAMAPSRYRAATLVLTHPWKQQLQEQTAFGLSDLPLAEVFALSDATGLPLRAWLFGGQAEVLYGVRDVTWEESLTPYRALPFVGAVTKSFIEGTGLAARLGVRYAVILSSRRPSCPLRAIWWISGPYRLYLCERSAEGAFPIVFRASEVRMEGFREERPPLWRGWSYPLLRPLAAHAFGNVGPLSYRAGEKDPIPLEVLTSVRLRETKAPVWRTVSRGDTRVVLRRVTAGAGWLVLDILAAPGWRYRCGGRWQVPGVAYRALLAIPVREEDRECVVRYRLPPWNG